MSNNFSHDELREMHDALHEAMERMLTHGESHQEWTYSSLLNAWSARKKCVEALLGTPLPAWVSEVDTRVSARLHLSKKDRVGPDLPDGAEILYRVGVPHAIGQRIVVYGNAAARWWEWRLEEGSKVLRDTKDHGYDSAEIALHDALLAVATRRECAPKATVRGR